MNLLRAMAISASGLQAQRSVIKATATNLANTQTINPENGLPYPKKSVIFSPQNYGQPFLEILRSKLPWPQSLARTHIAHLPPLEFWTPDYAPRPEGVTAEIITDQEGFKKIYDPTHPQADEHGYVLLPDINLVEEMVKLMMAVRQYEANVTSFNSIKNMIMKALEIGK
ncbi:MAG: flagellar basal body rod protein FlgC [Thermodesulfobacteriota bacterium]